MQLFISHLTEEFNVIRMLNCHNAQDNHPVLCIDESSSCRVISGGGDEKISLSHYTQDASSHATNLFQEKILLPSAGFTF